jgi:beta-N-acetylhexosaminidase
MTRKFILKFSVILLIIVFSTTAIIFITHNNKPIKNGENCISLENNSLEEILSQLSIEQKVGQMFMIGFWGTEPDYYVTKWINERNLGGVILFSYNIKDKEQVKTLIENLQELSKQTEPAIPLFIAVDQEGGVVSRLKVDGVSELTDQPSINSFDVAYSVGKRRGSELVELGFNMNFSPVLDVIKNENSVLYDRVFRGDVGDVSTFGSGMIKGYIESGIIPVSKHYPSYPDTGVDPHNDLPASQLVSDDILMNVTPFQTAINENIPIMVGHMLYPNVDKNNITSLSKIFITDMLRDQLNFKGVVITDDLEMGAIENNLSTGEIVKQAILAGNDILLFTSTPQKYADGYDYIVNAVKNGEIPESLIDESVLRILSLKKRFFYFE